MKILAVIGSPRKTGNTLRIVQRVQEDLMAYDKSIDLEYLFLRDCNLQMCTGCFACFARGEDKCPLRDDRATIADKMRQADGIILAAPTYAMGVPGLMKNFIDRFAYTCHRPALFDKVFLVVTTVGGVKGMKPALEQLAILAGGARLAGKLGVPAPPIPMAGLTRRADRSISKASKAFYSALTKQGRKLPGPGDWAWFHSFKSLCALESYQKVCPADCSYYQDKKEYFYPLAGHGLRRMVGRAFSGLMRLGMGFLVQRRP